MASNEESTEIGGVTYAREARVAAAEFIDLLMRSGLGRHRPIQDRSRIERMLANSNFIVSARLAGSLIGVVRGITDVAWCCYLSDVAVDSAFQGRGIGRHLMEHARREAGTESMCLLLSYPDAVSFYQGIGMKRFADAFLLERDLRHDPGAEGARSSAPLEPQVFRDWTRDVTRRMVSLKNWQIHPL